MHRIKNSLLLMIIIISTAVVGAILFGGSEERAASDSTDAPATFRGLPLEAAPVISSVPESHRDDATQETSDETRSQPPDSLGNNGAGDGGRGNGVLAEKVFALPFGDDGKVLAQRWLRDGIQEHLDHETLNPDSIELTDSQKSLLAEQFASRLTEIKSTLQSVKSAKIDFVNRLWESGKGERLVPLPPDSKVDDFLGIAFKTVPFEFDDLAPGQRISMVSRDGETRIFTPGWGEDQAFDRARLQLQWETEALVNDIRAEIVRTVRR